MISATTILIICAFGLALLMVWFIYRISVYRKKVSTKVESLAREIADLEKGSVPVKAAKKVPSASETPGIPGSEMLLIFHKDGKKPWRKALDLKLSEGGRMLIVTSRSPDSIRKEFDGRARIIWLNRSTAHAEMEDMLVINPTNLSRVLDEVQTFFSTGGGDGVVLLDRFEDLLDANDPSRTIRFLSMLKDSCRKQSFSALVPLSYRAVPQRTRNQLQEAFESVVI